MSILKQANEKFQDKKYRQAIDLWQLVIDENPTLAFTITWNIELAEKRLSAAERKTNRDSGFRLVQTEDVPDGKLETLPNSMGFIDSYSNGKVHGWASCETSESDYVEVDLFIDNHYVITQTASTYRKDLEKSGLGDGKRGFIIAIPRKFADDNDHVLEIRPGRHLRFENGCFSRTLTLISFSEGVVTLYKRPPAYSSQNNDVKDDRRTSILLVAHDASDNLFGSELSFLDMAMSVDRQKFKLILALPRPSKKYVDRLIPFADAIESVEKYWWTEGPTPKEDLVRDFQKLITKYKIELVYANTIMLREPLIAADRQKVRSACHVREVINQDEALLNKIGEPAEIVIEKVKNGAEYLVANSKLTREVFLKPRSTFLIYNGVDEDRLNLEILSTEILPFRVGMLSSNLLKKGIADFIELAKAARTELPEVVFTLVGPDSPDLTALKEELSHEQNPPNIEFTGYVDDPKEALLSLHVVVNFSHFAESFGRTVAEAMASGRPVIAYDYGALPELIENNRTGYIIPYKKPLNALEPLQNLFGDAVLYRRMAETARRRANQKFSLNILKQNFNGAIKAMLNARPVSKDGECELDEIPTVSVVIPNYNYANYLAERITSVLQQRHVPSEIIFLDDASTDDSVEVARELLSNSGIPYQIFTNETNAGIYSQWLRGIRESTGKWVWIAEADDSASPEFLSTLLTRDNDGVDIIYCQSKRIDAQGQVTSEKNLHHTDALSKTRWLADYSAHGRDEMALGLCYRNIIPNVSAVLMRRSALADIEHGLVKFASCGDWWLYAHILKKGRISYIADPLNYFRRHAQSQTLKKKSTNSYLDELACIHRYIAGSFRLLPKEVERFAEFVERDYKIEGYKRNLDHSVLEKAVLDSRRSGQGRKRIAFITTNDGSWNGGSEVLWRDSSIRLAEQGHDVVALCRRWAPRPPFEEEFAKLGIRVFYKQHDGFARLLELQPDLVVISTGDQDEGGDYFPDLIDKGIPFAIVNQLTKDPRFWRLRTERTPMLQSAYRNARLAFFTSKNNMRLMEDRLGFKLENGSIHFNPFHIDASKSIPLPPIETGYRVAVPAKLLFVHKGQDILVPIFSSEKWKSRNVVVDFYGEGPDGDLLAKKAHDAGIEKFRFHGRVADVKDIWSNCHAILMPSRMEGMPIVLISAMVAGRVPIVTNIGGAAEVVEDGYNGFIANDPEEAEVEEALERAWSHRSNWDEFGLRARLNVLSYLPKDPVGDFVDRLIRVT
jgi:glycosyltransferase involved in cell wall biosynthesis